ncbi:uncharacterized protein LOC113857662 [Abrus precatorius]|uniref:Uncharacterized protein LOC113857662 n=1 Tax=Abrus precatorius TaxID=3816 RepID=A0A8B8KP11_ABRPR|nr:uncharacterized protein LOC113857662 [Abrus precatorius]
MAREGSKNSTSRKRKRGFSRKLQVNERVEVRSEEDGFLGSWHPGTVICCGKLKRHVRYENLLENDGLNYLVDVVRVTKALDGENESLNCFKRGFIRPLPPTVVFDRWGLKFGLCVDVNHLEAWWEGAIFDHCDGEEKRTVFFPDLGDEMQVEIHQLRITQDWDEVTGKWEQRGNWVFLELIEELERETYVPVSIKQIWYDLQVKIEFCIIGEWTYNVKDLWRNMVMEIIQEYFTLTIEAVISVSKLQQLLLNEIPELELVEPISNVGQKETVPPVIETLHDFQDEMTRSGAGDLTPELESGEPVANADLKTTLPDKENVVQKEPVAAINETLPVFQNETTSNGAGDLNLPGNLLNETPELDSVETVVNVDLNITLPDKENVVEEELIPHVNETLPVDQIWSGELLHTVSKLLPKDAELCVMDGGAENKSTASQKRKCLRNSKANLLKCQSNGLPRRVLRSNKRVQKVSATCLHHKPLTILSWLIDSNMVLPRSKVYYKAKGKRNKVCIMAHGRITRNGVKCKCCLTIYSLVGFENHATGNSTCRPSANIFLEDGRSLLDCQKQIMEDHKTRQTMEIPFSDLGQGENDCICSFCHYGGELILCDQCPSSFHKICLGLEDILYGDWFCPSCSCGICGQSRIKGDEDGHFLTCIQCEHKYHVRCLETGAVDISRHLKNSFCGKDCKMIYEGFRKLLGKPVSVGADNLTWTLVKFINSDSCDFDSIKSDLLAESYSKLNLALSVMHECFEPLKEPLAGKDIMEDVLFSRWSELNRLNFQGFYTVLLERNDELISVATVRVFGKKIAEVPLVGTRLQYRRHGMCHILMNELEKKLMQLGVERLVLPAVPSVLETWTRSFGFAKMTSSERFQFLHYTFLDFQDTIMCQKLLMKIPSPDSVLLKDSQKKCDFSSGRCSFNFKKSSPVCEVYQVEEIDKGGMLDQLIGEDDAIATNRCDVFLVLMPAAMIIMVKQPSHGDKQRQNGSNSQCSLLKQAHSHSKPIIRKVYARRRNGPDNSEARMQTTKDDRYNGPPKYYARKTKKACEGFRMSL